LKKEALKWPENSPQREVFMECFAICFSRAASVLDLSQSVGGFLRKIFNTLTTRSENLLLDPPKKNLFTGKTKEGY